MTHAERTYHLVSVATAEVAKEEAAMEVAAMAVAMEAAKEGTVEARDVGSEAHHLGRIDRQGSCCSCSHY